MYKWTHVAQTYNVSGQLYLMSREEKIMMWEVLRTLRWTRGLSFSGPHSDTFSSGAAGLAAPSNPSTAGHSLPMTHTIFCVLTFSAYA